jgi:hypothetical protein
MPRDVTVTFDNKTSHVYRNVPDNVTPDQIEQRTKKDYPSLRLASISGSKKAATPAPAPTFMEDAGNYMRGIARGVATGDPAALLARGGTYLTDVLGLTTGANEKINAVLNAGENTQNKMFRTGQVLGEVASTAPLIAAGGGAVSAGGRALARVAPRAGGVVQRTGAAIQTGGIGSGRTAAQTAAMPLRQRQAQLLERTAGASIAGAGGAALTGDDAGTGATFAAALPAVGSIARKVAGVLPDLFNLPALQAARILRESLGDNLEAARAALSALPADAQELVRQTLVRAGVEPRTFMGLAADVEKLRADQAMGILEGQTVAREARLAGAAGGATMEEIRAAAREGRKAVTEELAPTREAMYERAGRASREVPPALRQAQALEQQAQGQSDLARRMTFGAERAETRLGQLDDLGDTFDPAAVGRERGIAGAMTQRGEQAALNAIGLRGEAGDLYDMVDDLASQGMQPMRAADLISALRGKLAAPEILSGSIEERTIKNVVRQLEKATDANGMLNPRALGKIRRSGINEIVNRLSTQMGGVPSRTGTPEAAQGTVLELRSLIDDTLRRGGGGDLVDDFLRRSEQGYAAVNRGELAGEAFRLYKQDPTAATEFRALVGGDRPKVVGKFMGGGPENEIFANAFANDPARLGALQQTADEMRVLNRMGELSSQGRESAAQLAYRERPSVLMRGLTGAALSMSPPTRIAAQGAEMASTAYMAPRVERQLAEAAISGPNMLALMDQYPSSLRMSEAVSNLSPGMRNALAQLLRSGTMNYNQ